MQLRDAEIWQSWVDANQDSYGKACVDYAERWADLMEEWTEGGALVEDVAEDTSHEADTEGITGFMYGCAVSMLARAWKHGEALRLWHNLDRQIGDEGERANKGGGVLNPAILNVG